MFEKLHEECGVFGISSPGTQDVAKATYLALYALQHRGQESCGIAVNDDGVFTHYRDVGLVSEVFTDTRLRGLGQGNIAIGHVRYAPKGALNRANAQPLDIRHVKGNMALAYNGALTNAVELRREFENNGGIFHSVTDTEVIAYTITRARLTAPSIEKAVEQAMCDLKGAYSLVLMSATKLIAARDPVGFRPLCIGKCPDGSYVVASETCAFDAVGASYIREVEPGEIVVIKDGQIESIRTHCTGKGKICVFEYIYFARPDSVIEGLSVHKARAKIGEILAKEHPVEADVVFGVPNSGIDAALGYAAASGIPYTLGFVKSNYVARTFIQPTQIQREDAVRLKLNVLRANVEGKRVIMVDDSIVRGTTCARIVKMLRDAGAKEVHVRISSPKFIAPCYFGTDVDGKESLIACQLKTDEAICKYIGADTLGFLSIEGTRELTKDLPLGICDGCFTENYPVEPPKHNEISKFENKINK